MRTTVFPALALGVCLLCSLAGWFWPFLLGFWGWCLLLSKMKRFLLAEPQSQPHALRISSSASWQFIDSLLETSCFVPTLGPLGFCSVVTWRKHFHISGSFTTKRGRSWHFLYMSMCDSQGNQWRDPEEFSHAHSRRQRAMRCPFGSSRTSLSKF